MPESVGKLTAGEPRDPAPYDGDATRAANVTRIDSLPRMRFTIRMSPPPSRRQSETLFSECPLRHEIAEILLGSRDRDRVNAVGHRLEARDSVEETQTALGDRFEDDPRAVSQHGEAIRRHPAWAGTVHRDRLSRVEVRDV